MPCQALLCEHSSEQRPSSPTTACAQVLNSRMEPAGAESELSWSTFNSGMVAEESQLMEQLLGGYPFSHEQDHDPSLPMQSLFWSDHSVHSYHGTQDDNTNNMYYLPLENSCTLSACNYYNKQASLVHESYYMESDMLSTTGMRCLEEANITAPSVQVERDNHVDGKISMSDWKEQSRENLGAIVIHDVQKGKRKIRACEPVVNVDNRERPAVSPRKKARASPQAGKCAKNAKSKKVGRDAKVVEEEVGTPVIQSTSCYGSEDDSNHSHEPNEGGAARSSSKGSVSLNSDEKTRAGRGSATNPQSLYARKRREKINERLRVLQNLVPNGTKVDISTMLEEAVQYVKFLKLQIKLLSSDELWMYAPISYYGMNIGINMKISEP